jgi:hypothetical protein
MELYIYIGAHNRFGDNYSCGTIDLNRNPMSSRSRSFEGQDKIIYNTYMDLPNYPFFNTEFSDVLWLLRNQNTNPATFGIGRNSSIRGNKNIRRFFLGGDYRTPPSTFTTPDQYRLHPYYNKPNPEMKSCELSNWTDWSVCDGLCNDVGTQTRTRTIRSQPTNNGTPCPPDSELSQTRNCIKTGCEPTVTTRILEPIGTGNIEITNNRSIKETQTFGNSSQLAYFNNAITYKFTYTGGRFATFIHCRIYEWDDLWSAKWEDVTGNGTPIYSLTDKSVTFEYRRIASRAGSCGLIGNVSDCNNINPVKIAFQLILNKDNQTYFKTFKKEYGVRYINLGPTVPIDLPLSIHDGLTDSQKTILKKSP